MISIKDIMDFLREKENKFEFIGDEASLIEGFSSMNRYKENTVTWCKSVDVLENQATGYYRLLVAPAYKKGIADNYIIVKNPKEVFFGIIERFFSTASVLPKVGINTFISERVKLGRNVRIGNNCILDGNIVIGDDTVIYHNVSIMNDVVIGSNCVIQTGTIIGHDDYSYVEDEFHRKKMIKQYGGVEIGDDVFIGSQCIINRGTIDNTIIGNGCKIDSQCIVSHNVTIGENSALICGTKLLGSVNIGENTYIATAVVKNQLHVGKNVVIGLGSVVLKSINDNVTVVGVPAKALKGNKV